MFIVGLTGGIATGKSSVTKILQEHSIPVIDADCHARKVVEPGKPAWKKIKAEFGDNIMKTNGQLDREKLGMIIFQDKVKRKKLNEITHPEIYKGMFWETLMCLRKGYAFVVLDLPLLFEAGSMVDYCHKIIVVTCDQDQQFKRLMERDILCEKTAKLRIESQMPLDEKAKLANFVIDNSGTEEETRKQVEQVIQLLKADKFHWKVRVFGGCLVSLAAVIILWIFHGSF